MFELEAKRRTPRMIVRKIRLRLGFEQKRSKIVSIFKLINLNGKKIPEFQGQAKIGVGQKVDQHSVARTFRDSQSVIRNASGETV